MLRDFGVIAEKLSKNPLSIIALFIVMIYAFACLVVGYSKYLQSSERIIIVYFIALFPVIVIGIFAWLVSCHHSKLYSPSDYKDENNFLKHIHPQLSSLPRISNENNNNVLNNSNSDIEKLISERDGIYKRNRGFFISYILEPSQKEDQEYDIFIYLIKHKSNFYSDVQKAEFFFGNYWGNKIYTASRAGDYLGVRTSAYGAFLALCKLTFKDGEEVIIDKYIDFEMGKAIKAIQENI